MSNLHELQQRMAERGLSGHFDALKHLARSAVRLYPEAACEDSIPLGASKFGGHPDLPAGTAWPRRPDSDIPLSFLAQIDLAQVHPYDTANELPAAGLLSIFYDCSEDGMPWGFNPEDNAGWKVLYWDGCGPLQRMQEPDDLAENGCMFAAASLSFETRMELPNPESDLCDQAALPDDDQDDYWEWLDEETECPTSKLLGHADVIQGGMEEECQIVTRGYNTGNPDGYHAARAAGADEGAQRWRLLMQLDSHEELGMMWGDLGRLFLWMTQEDLAARRFDRVWLILQCG